MRPPRGVSTSSVGRDLIVYRPFSNSDLPGLVDIWRGQALNPGLAQPMSLAFFEASVLSKTYFDREGLIVAVDDGTPVAFVHASFGPTDCETQLSPLLGAINLLLVRADYARRGIGRTLLNLAEAYLRARGAQVLYCGGIRPLNAFYVGLYGGSELPGILESDAPLQRLAEAAGYRPIDHVVVLQRPLSGFRPPVDRRMQQIRRTYALRTVNDPPSNTWWQACTYGGFDCVRYELVAAGQESPAATLTAWHMESFSSARGVRSAGLLDLEVAPPLRRQGLALFLVGEALKHLAEQGVSIVEVQTMQANVAAQGLYKKLGFAQVNLGTIYRKDEAAPP